MIKAMPFAVLALGILVALSGSVFAQDSIKLPPTIKPLIPRDLREKIQNAQDKRADIKNAITNVREDAKEKRMDLQRASKDKIRAATSSDAKRDVVKDTRQNAKTIIEARRASTTPLKQELKELTRKHFAVSIQRFSIAIKQFDNLAQRIQSRIDKIKSTGIDTSSVEAALAAARSAIETARADAKAVSDIVAQVKDTGNARDVRREIETAVKKASANVKAAHKALSDAARALAGLGRTQKGAATSTFSN